MLDKEYVFKGKYGEIVSRLTSNYDGITLFNTNYELMVFSALVGFLYSRNELKYSTDENIVELGLDKKIDLGKILKERNKTLFYLRLITLLDKKEEPDFEKRVDNSFKYYNNKKVLENFERYIFTGLEVLEEKIFINSNYFDNYYDFINEYEERYNNTFDYKNTLELINLTSL